MLKVLKGRNRIIRPASSSSSLVLDRAALLIAVALILVGAPSLISTFYSNSGSISLLNSIGVTETSTSLANSKQSTTVALEEQAISWDRGNSSAWKNLGIAHYGSGSIANAIVDWRNSSFAVARLLIERAVYELRQGNVQLALDTVNVAAQTDTTAQQTYPQVYAFVHGELGKVYVLEIAAVTVTPSEQKSLTDRAIAEFNTALQFDPNRGEYRYNLGKLYNSSAQTAKAEAELRQVVQTSAAWRVPAYRELAAIYIASEQWDAATAAFEGVLQVNPTDRTAFEGLVNIYEQSDQPEKALDLVTHWAESATSTIDQATAYSTMGKLYSGRSDLNSAVAAYRRAVELDPSVIAYHIALALALEAQGKRAEAISELLLVTDAPEPRSRAWVNSTLGDLYKADGRVKEAIDAYVMATRDVPNRIDYQLALALLYQQDSQWEAAKAIYREVLRMQPDEPTATAQYAALLEQHP